MQEQGWLFKWIKVKVAQLLSNKKSFDLKYSGSHLNALKLFS